MKDNRITKPTITKTIDDIIPKETRNKIYWNHLEVTNEMFSSPKLTDEQLRKVMNHEWYRASGECECPVCGELYKKHTLLRFGELHLNELCNLDLVKL